MFRINAIEILITLVQIKKMTLAYIKEIFWDGNDTDGRTDGRTHTHTHKQKT